MKGKRGLIMGLANDKSLAWGIAKKLHEGRGTGLFLSGRGAGKAGAPAGREPGLRFPDRLRRVRHGRSTTTFATLAARWPTIDFVVHAIGFSDKNELRGRYV
jgi:enoyl-[acyl-carrier protein] reductase I